MLRKSLYKKLKKAIDTDIYKRLRLLRDDGKEELTQIVPYNSYAKLGVKGAQDKLDYIAFKLNNDLPPGRYIIQTSTFLQGNLGVTDNFAVNKHPQTITINEEDGQEENDTTIENFTQSQEDMGQIDIEDYKEVLDEKSNLKALAEAQALKIKVLEQQLAEQKSLSDSAPKERSGMEILADSVKDIAPSVIGILDEFFKMKNSQIELEKQKLSSGKSAKNITRKLKKKSVQLDKDEVVAQMSILQEEDPDKFEEAMDEMEQTHPELYDYVCNKLDLFEEDEEMEDNEEEEAA